MVYIDGKQIKKPLAAGVGHCVTSVVRICPCVSTRCQTPVRQQVKHTLSIYHSPVSSSKNRKQNQTHQNMPMQYAAILKGFKNEFFR